MGYAKLLTKYRFHDAIEHFLNTLENVEDYIKEVLEYPEPMEMTEEDRRAHKNATICHICEEPLNAKLCVTMVTSPGNTGVLLTKAVISS